MVGVPDRRDHQVGEPADRKVDVAGDVEVGVRVKRDKRVVLGVAPSDLSRVQIVQVLITNTSLKNPTSPSACR